MSGLGQTAHWVGVTELEIELDPERIGAAMELAALNGWLTVGGMPAHSVAIAATGINLIAG